MTVDPLQSSPLRTTKRSSNTIALLASALLLGAFASAVVLLDGGIRDYENLNAERQAGLAASVVWEYLNMGPPGPTGPRSPDHDKGSYGDYGDSLSAERDQTLLPELLSLLDNEKGSLPSPQFHSQSSSLQTQYLANVRGLMIVGRGGEVLSETGSIGLDRDDIPAALRAARVLPFGDMALEASDGCLLYIRNAAPRLRMGYNNPSPQRLLILAYDTSDLRAESGVRRLLLFGISIVAAALVLVAFVFYSRNRKLRVHNAQQETLARLGMAARTLAHEIRNPLSVILMQKHMLQRSLGDAHTEALDRIDREAERIANLTRKVKDMLDKPGGNPETCLVSECLNELVASNPEWQERCAEHVDADAIVSIDPEHLRTILGNLIDNAIRQNNQNRVTDRITLSTRLVGDSVEIHVKDSGGGVPRAIEKKIFNPFFTTRSDGSGVGLSLSRSLAEAAGATLSFRNHILEGKRGADFILTLPRKEKRDA